MAILIEKILPRLEAGNRAARGKHGLPDDLVAFVHDKAASAAFPVHGSNCEELHDDHLTKTFACREKMDTVWYFAYGSNLNSVVFEGRRKIQPIQHYAAVAHNWSLMFDMPALPLLEPAMANIQPVSGTFVHGAVFGS